MLKLYNMKLSQNNRKHQKTTMLPGAEACNHAAGTASLVGATATGRPWVDEEDKTGIEVKQGLYSREHTWTNHGLSK
jgi:hypothetical protein